MNELPLVSILINNYNYERFISQAIDSELEQTYHDIQAVVDEGSTDYSRQVIDSYGNQIIKIFKENGRPASALNAGFAVSKGGITCLLDADDIFLPTKISENEIRLKAFYYFPKFNYVDLV
jgi:glycosyltransferase involved in cell wall biosynthesis